MNALARPRCTCTIDMPGTRYEARILDRACPRHGDVAEAAHEDHRHGERALRAELDRLEGAR